MTTTEGSGFAASHTLEYSFSSYAVAQFAKQLNKSDDYEKLMRLSKGWEKLYDADKKLIRPRNMEGEFIEEFDPLAPWIGFQEGNAVQYTFYVPHDIEELVGIWVKKPSIPDWTLFLSNPEIIFLVEELKLMLFPVLRRCIIMEISRIFISHGCLITRVNLIFHKSG